MMVIIIIFIYSAQLNFLSILSQELYAQMSIE